MEQLINKFKSTKGPYHTKRSLGIIYVCDKEDRKLCSIFLRNMPYFESEANARQFSESENMKELLIKCRNEIDLLSGGDSKTIYEISELLRRL